MRKNGFTLVELLAVIIIMGLLATMIFPMIDTSLSNSKENAFDVVKSNIISAAKDWSAMNVSKLPESGDSINVKLSELKQGYLPLNVKNPKTNAIISNESYVYIRNYSGNYVYSVYIYDIPDYMTTNTAIIFTGNLLIEELDQNSEIGNYDITVKDGNGTVLDYSKQYIFNDEEIGTIDTSVSGVYSIVYTVLYNNNIYKAVKTIIIK